MQRILQDVYVNHEALIFRRGRICPESFVVASLYGRRFRRPSRYLWFLLKNYWLRRGGTTLPSGLWVIDNFSPDNYHHWLVDCLSRILDAETVYPQERRVLLPRYYGRQPYIAFTLRAFPNITVAWIEARVKVRVSRLAFVPRRPPVALGRPPSYRADLLGEISRRVGDLAGEPRKSRRIYFSRSDTGSRRAVNEREVVRVLRSHDIEVVHIDPAKPWEQVRLSREAHVMVGVHGAALSNLIFMPPGGRVLELRRPERANVFFFDHYRPLASAMGLDFRSQSCELAQEVKGYSMNHADLRVDLDALRENLSWALNDQT